MKSYLFTTDNDRGGVMLCDIDEFDEAVEYLCERFAGVVKVEAGDQTWQIEQSTDIATEQVEAETPATETSAAPEADLFG